MGAGCVSSTLDYFVFTPPKTPSYANDFKEAEKDGKTVPKVSPRDRACAIDTHDRVTLTRAPALRIAGRSVYQDQTRV